MAPRSRRRRPRPTEVCWSSRRALRPDRGGGVRCGLRRHGWDSRSETGEAAARLSRGAQRRTSTGRLRPSRRAGGRDPVPLQEPRITDPARVAGKACPGRFGLRQERRRRDDLRAAKKRAVRHSRHRQLRPQSQRQRPRAQVVRLIEPPAVTAVAAQAGGARPFDIRDTATNTAKPRLLSWQRANKRVHASLVHDRSQRNVGVKPADCVLKQSSLGLQNLL